ncbi:snf2 domain-containing protein classy 3 [Phtheirospermum japonicum]|uniref:Snf2 domain-containing protein classy 3 n=1 Tax=Phtheirospermum japonicum TaxID=374723 RepID=A0A830DBB9_9LAMI|nr:snf2 domain-containing protein classy 3 [Phtheirospermum japonicum]
MKSESEMRGGGGSNPMSSAPRPRTRSEHAKYWKNVHDDLKKKRKNDGEGIYYFKGDSVKSWEKHGFVIIGEKNGFEDNAGSSRSSKRTKNVVKEPDSPINRVSEGDDDEVEFLGSGKPILENGPPSKVVNSDNNGVTRGRGRPRKKPVDACVDLEKLTDSSNSMSESDEATSDEEDEDKDEDEDESSDEDYRASSPESSDAPYYGSYDEQENDGAGENKKVITDEDERVNKEMESDNESAGVVKATVNDDGEFCSVGKSKRMHEKKVSEDEQEIEDRLFKINRKKDGEPHYYGCTEKARKNKDKKNNGEEDDLRAFFQKMDVKSTSKKESKLSNKKTFGARRIDLIKVLVESINSTKEHNSQDYGLTRSALPLKFGFEDEMPRPHTKSDWEMEIDSLFCGLELGLLESNEINCTDSHVVEKDDIDTEIDQSPAAYCARGKHEPILDEQIGITCKYCLTVILEIKYYTPPPGRFDHRKEPDEPQSYYVDPIRLCNSGDGVPNYTHRAQGTVWDLIPGVENELYPHQREGFEFMWNNIAGNIVIDEMKRPLTGGSGCIISHAPGTGKTRLSIVFLQTFLMMYPTCRPVIIAPKGMLLTWEAEFLKWKVNIPFHNLNKKELSDNETAFAAEKLGQVFGGTGPMSVECKRLVKLASWVCGGCILGVSYQLFAQLVWDEESGGGLLKDQMKKLLLESPGLLVLDEGHTARNDNSKIWKSLTKVSTQHRIILSGTPFQNNLHELFNTLSVVNPKFAHGIESEIKILKSRRMGRKELKNLKKGTILKLRTMLDPFVHVHKGTILKESLPGLRNTLVFLHPTELQKELLEASSKTHSSIFHRIRQVSLISVHPSLMSEAGMSLPPRERKSEDIESVDAGVKTRFVLKLIQLADALGERVLVFSQFIDPLEFIRKKIKSEFSWNEGREVLYMDGQLDERQRQDSISSFNDETSKVKVLLASERACSEGINLVGASRVVLLDTVWNPSVEKQAVSRAYRLGQKKVVYVYRLCTSGTEVRQYAQQIEKVRMSQLLFSSTRDGEALEDDETVEESEDKVLEAMLGLERFGSIFERIIRQPKKSDLVEIFGLVDRD